MPSAVWSVAQRDGFVTDVQAMRRRVLDHLPPDQAPRQLKLGPGGLRDVEFAVQLLQLVHGRSDERIRAPATLSALAELTRAGYVGRADGAALDAAYRFLRMLEHRVQHEDGDREDEGDPEPAPELRNHVGVVAGVRRSPGGMAAIRRCGMARVAVRGLGLVSPVVGVRHVDPRTAGFSFRVRRGERRCRS